MEEPQIRSDDVRKKGEHVIRLAPLSRKEAPQRSSLRPDHISEESAPRPASKKHAQDQHPITAEDTESEFLEHWQNKHNDELELNTMPSPPARPKARAAASHTGRRPAQVIPDQEPLRPAPPQWNSLAGPAKRVGRMRYAGALAGIAVFAGGFIALTTLAARLTVAVKPNRDQTVLQDVALTLDTSAASVIADKRIIPAEKLTFAQTLTRQFTATGRDASATRAHGRVRITNMFSMAPQPLVAGTRFLTDSGILFRLEKADTIPAAGGTRDKPEPQSVEVQVVADSIGIQGNIPDGTHLTIPGFKGTPKFEGFSATAAGAFTGGAPGGTMSAAVTKDDLKKAEEEVTKAAYGQMKDEITLKVPPGFIAPQDLRAIEVTDVNAPAAGAHQETFTVSARAAATVLAFHESDAAALAALFALNGNADREVIPHSDDLTYHAKDFDGSKSRTDIMISGTIMTRAIVRGDLVASLIAGKSKNAIQDVLGKQAAISGFTLSFFPPWRSSAPADTGKITVQTEGE